MFPFRFGYSAVFNKKIIPSFSENYLELSVCVLFPKEDYRFLCGVGVMARYFDFDAIIKDPDFENKIFPAHLVRPDMSLGPAEEISSEESDLPRFEFLPALKLLLVVFSPL